MHLAALLVDSLSALTKSSEHWGIVGVYTAGNRTSFIRVPVNNGGLFDDKDYSTGVIYSNSDQDNEDRADRDRRKMRGKSA